MWVAKSYSHFFSKSTCEFDIVLTRTVNILTTNKLVELTMLWTTGPRYFSHSSTKDIRKLLYGYSLLSGATCMCEDAICKVWSIFLQWHKNASYKKKKKKILSIYLFIQQTPSTLTFSHDIVLNESNLSGKGAEILIKNVPSVRMLHAHALTRFEVNPSKS